jgi:hypothetical protein
MRDLRTRACASSGDALGVKCRTCSSERCRYQSKFTSTPSNCTPIPSVTSTVTATSRSVRQRVAPISPSAGSIRKGSAIVR